MYACTDCKKHFFDPKIIFEKHDAPYPPYEKHLLCPYCEGKNVVYLETRHCKCCGARIPYDKTGDYCKPACEKRGKRLWELEAKRRKQRILSPVYAAVRRVEQYNKKHGKSLSYGQFFSKDGGKENEA